MARARDGDTVMVLPGTYRETVDFAGKDVVLTSKDPDDAACVRATVIEPIGNWTQSATAVRFEHGETRAAVIQGLTVTTAVEGRGIFCANGACPTIRGNRIVNNWGSFDGGAIHTENGAPLILGNTIVSNGCESHGAIYVHGGTADIRANLIAGNSAGMCGAGGITLVNADALIDGNTITGNYGGDELMDPAATGAVAVYNGQAAITNCIIWGNSASWGWTPSQLRAYNGTISVAYTCLDPDENLDQTGVFPGEGLIAQNPLFADPGNRDFHLQSTGGRWDPATEQWTRDSQTSPAMDAGKPDSEWDKEPAPNGMRRNLGCYGNTAQASRSDAPPLVVVPRDVTVHEGATACVTVRLSDPPVEPVAAYIEFGAQSDPDLSIQGVNVIEFTDENWDLDTPVTLIAQEDSDALAGTGILLFSIGGMPCVQVDVTEQENDASLRVIGGIPEGATLHPVGENVEIRALPPEHRHFVEWTGDRDAVQDPSSSRTTVQVTHNCVVEARFEPDRHTLAAAVIGQGAVCGAGTYDWGTDARVEAVPAPGWEFVCWHGDVPETDIHTNPVVLTVGSDLTVTAEFKPKPPEFILSTTHCTVTEAGQRRVTVGLTQPPADTVLVKASWTAQSDDSLRIEGPAEWTVTPADWDDDHALTIAAAEDPDAETGTAVLEFHAPGIPVARIVVTEQENDARLTVAATAGGAISPRGTAVHPLNTPVTLHAAPFPDFRFEGWECDPGLLPDLTAPSVTFVLTHTVSITAHFAPLGVTRYVNAAVGDDSFDGLNAQPGVASGPKKTIQGAIDASFSGDTIVVAPGVYPEQITFGGKNITLRSQAPTDPATVKETVISPRQTGGWALTAVTFSHGETAQAEISGFTISTEGGRGILCTGHSNPTISRNRIVDNWGFMESGGITCIDSSPVIADNMLSGNGGEWTGAISITGGTPVLRGNLIVRNTATFVGAGGITLWNSSAVVENNTVAHNSGGDEWDWTSAGGIACVDSPATIRNCIVWGNTWCWGSDANQMRIAGDPPSVSYTCLEGGLGNIAGDVLGGNGNIAIDPLFAAPESNDYHLRSPAGRWDPTAEAWACDSVQSPALDAGDPQCAADCEPLPNGARVNMGCYGNSREASRSGHPSTIVLSQERLAIPEGGEAEFTVMLAEAVEENVEIELELTPQDGVFAMSFPSPMVFSTTDWDRPRQIRVSTVQNDTDTACQEALITATATNGQTAQIVLSEIDDDARLNLSGGHPAGLTVVTKGTRTAIHAEVPEGYRFSHWDGDVAGVEDVQAAETVVLIHADTSLRAVLEPIRHTLTVVSEFGTPSGQGTYRHGETVSWRVESPQNIAPHVRAKATPAHGTVTMTDDRSVVVQWRTEYYLDIGGTGHGTATPDSSWFPQNATVSVLARPDAGYEFREWSGDIPADARNQNPIVLPMDCARSIAPSFSVSPVRYWAYAAAGLGAEDPTPNRPLREWVKASINDAGGWSSDLSLQVPASQQGIAVDNVTLTDAAGLLMVADGFEYDNLGTAPGAWHRVENGSAEEKVETVASPVRTGQRAMRLGGSNCPGAVLLSSPPAADGVRLDLDVHVFQNPEPDTALLTIYLKGVCAGIRTDPEGRPRLHLGQTPEASRFPGAVPLTTNAWNHVVLVIKRTVDTDRDGLDDAWEMRCLHTLDSDGADDTDGDGLTDRAEYQAGSDPNHADTDNDGLTDADEVWQYGTDPAAIDTDRDGMSDAYEAHAAGLSPTRRDDPDADPDNDGLTNAVEMARGTSPLNPDSDNDGIGDGIECNTRHTDPLDRDTDHDGIPDASETNSGTFVSTDNTGTDPTMPDSDRDGIDDGIEIENGLDPCTPDADQDADGDSVPNQLEIALGTDPLDAADLPPLMDALKTLACATQPAPARTERGNTAAPSTGDAPAAGTQIQWPGSAADDAALTAIAWIRCSGGGRIAQCMDADNGTCMFSLMAEADGTIWTLSVRADSTFSPNGVVSMQTDTTESLSDWTLVALVVDRDSGCALYVNGMRMPLRWSGGTRLGMPGQATRLVLTSAADSTDARTASSFDGEIACTALFAAALQQEALENLIALGPDAELGSWLQVDDDDDTLPDFWEQGWLGTRDLGPDDDPDDDGLSNIREYQAGTRPDCPDTDADGLGDGYEVNQLQSNPLSSDSDKDGLTDTVEVQEKMSDPTKADSDGDGLEDGWEVANSLSPIDQDSDGDGVADSLEDADQDGLTNAEEATLGTPPEVPQNGNARISFKTRVTTVKEGDLNVPVKIVLSTMPPNRDTVEVTIVRAGGSARPGEDIDDFSPQRVVFAPDCLEQAVWVRVWRDTRREPTETVRLSLAEPAGAELGPRPGHQIRIADSLSPQDDSDLDGLPDEWEERFFGNLEQTADGDLDGDGLTNLREYLIGSRPTKPIKTDTGNRLGLAVTGTLY
jgi:hypothetical protein